MTVAGLNAVVHNAKRHPLERVASVTVNPAIGYALNWAVVAVALFSACQTAAQEGRVS